MSTLTKNYGLTKPDINDFYDISVENANIDIIDTELKKSAEHIANKNNPHSVTKSQVGLSNVPNVSTNDQTPTYTVATSNAALSSGEKLSVAFGKIAKAVSSLISHLNDTVSHVTSAERTKWDAKVETSTLTQVGLLNNHLATTAISESFTFQDLCKKTQVTFFTNWEDNTNFPSKYGSGIILPGLDGSHRVIFYSGAVNDEKSGYLGKAYLTDGTWIVAWHKTSDNGNADTLDGFHADRFLIKGSDGTIAAIPVFSGGTTGREGGEIHLTKGPDGGLTSNVIIDVVGESLRVLAEHEGIYKSFTIDFNTMTWEHRALHTGNSVPVIISDAAPTDTTALWVS